MDIKTLKAATQNESVVKRIGYDVLALIGGLLIPLASAPFEWRLLAFLSTAIFFHIMLISNSRQALWRAWLFGCGLFGLGTYWLYFTLSLFGNAVAPLAVVLTALFVMGLALTFVLLAWLISRFSRVLEQPLAFVLIIPSLWTLMELFRGWFLSGFPWLLLGTTQVDSVLSGYAPVTGVYGVSWLVALVASLGLLIFYQWQAREIFTRHQCLLAGLIASVLFSGYLLQRVQWSHADGDKLSVRLVQGNIEQSMKFDEKILLDSIKSYQALSQIEKKTDLIVWPETAIADFYFRVEDIMRPFVEQLDNTHLLVGTFQYDRSTGHYFNSLLNVADPSQTYRKRHLVPFGEFMPLRQFLTFLSQYIAIPMSDLFPGSDEQEVMQIGGVKLGVLICYEDAFPEEVISVLPEATLLLNVSNDSWFGDSLAPHQHLEIARYRALETARPLLRVANTGISGIISHRGKVLIRSRQFVAEAIDYEVQPRQGVTPYMWWGNNLVLGIIFVLIFTALIITNFLRKNV